MNKEIVLQNDVNFLPSKKLRSGELELLYEAGRVRYIKSRGEEVLRMIYPALRAVDWSTVNGRIDNEIIEEKEDGFVVTYDWYIDKDDIRYKASFDIRARHNKLEYTMRGQALSSFKSKRTGLCVHHPLETCSGKDVAVTHPDGNVKTYKYPSFISPEWPFTDITQMKWNTGATEVKLEFEGDVFEMEDQRNWTDNSYKTYSGPQYYTPMLDINNGDEMFHKVTLTVDPQTNYIRDIHTNPVTRYPFPKIGYGRGADQSSLSKEEIDLLKQVPFDHYRVEIKLSDRNWQTILDDSIKETKELNTKLELAVIFDDSFEIFLQWVEKYKEYVIVIHVLPADGAVLPVVEYTKIYKKLKQRLPNIRIGLGNNGWFADLNSCKIENIDSDILSFMVSPQVHQDDNLSILENLGSQHTTIQTLRNRRGDIPVYVSPILFNSREADVRLKTQFASWWTINTIANLADAGHLSFYEVKGEKGILNAPLYDILKQIKDFSPTIIYRENGNVVLENDNKDSLTFKTAN